MSEGSCNSYRASALLCFTRGEQHGLNAERLLLEKLSVSQCGKKHVLHLCCEPLRCDSDAVFPQDGCGNWCLRFLQVQTGREESAEVCAGN